MNPSYFKFLSDNSNISVISESASPAYIISSDCDFFSLPFPCLMLLYWEWNIMYYVIGNNGNGTLL